MKRKLRNNELAPLAKFIKEKIFIPQSAKKTSVFLCGADINDNEKGRSKMASVFEEHSQFELLYPEDLFDDLLAGQGQHSLMNLENILADSVDAILLLPESPGSFAELGAFSNKIELARKTIIISNKKFKNKKSFINYGPYRLIKASGTGKVIHINYDDLTDTENKIDIFRRIKTLITHIKKNHPVEKNVGNILETENFILPCIYIVDEINNVMLYQLIAHATNQNQNLCEIATKSALSRLISKRFITRTPDGYQTTVSGAQHVRQIFNSKELDKARVELLNAENRKNSSIKYDRV